MKAANQAIVGLFTIGAILLFLGGIFYLGGRDLFHKKHEYVVYFEGSVGGLTVGSPVVLRGVPLGKVTRISLITNPRESTVSIPVNFSIDRSSLRTFNNSPIDDDLEHKVIRRMVDLGLRAHLEIKSMITGQLAIELNFEKDPPPARYHSENPEYEIPSIRSSYEEIEKRLKDLPLEDTVKSLQKVLADISRIIASGHLERGLAGFADTFEESARILRESRLQVTAQNVLNNLDHSSQTLNQKLPAAIDNFNKTMANLATASSQASQLLDRNSSIVQDLRRLLRDGADASRSLRNLADMLERNPEALLKGKKGGR